VTFEVPPKTTATTPTTAASRAFAADAKATRGALPDRGPARQKLRAVPFEVTRDEADAAFQRYHSRHWLQARQLPALRRGAKETFLPFWVVPPGGALVRTRLTRASLGVDRLVSRYDSRTGRREPRWETEWTDVELRYDSVAAVLATEAFSDGGWAGGGGPNATTQGPPPSPAEQERACARAAAAAGVDHCYAPGDARLQLYAGSPKYGRGDARKVGPSWAVGRARPITPEMLSSSPLASAAAGGGGRGRQPQQQGEEGEDDCRRVGPFVMPPDVARRLAARQLQALEGQRCEDVVRALAPRVLRQGGGGGGTATRVRLLDLRVGFLLTGGGGGGGGGGAGGGGGVAVAPVYAPVFVFSWRHAGVKVRTMVSGVRPFGGVGAGGPNAPSPPPPLALLLRVAGPILPDETKVAVLTTAAVLLGLQVTGAAAAISGASLFYGGFVLPFIGAGLAARVWPAARTLADRGGERAVDAAAGIAGAGADAAKGLYARFASATQQLFGVRLPGSGGGGAGAGAGSASSATGGADDAAGGFDAEYVRAYEHAEGARSRRADEEEARRARAGQDYSAAGGGGPESDDPFTFTAEDLAEAVRNPFAWAERKAAEMARRHARRRAGEQARRDQYERRYGAGQQWQQQGGQQYQDQQRQQQQQQQRAGARPPPGAPASPRDPQGFYKSLGVPPDATTAEIQAAFRGKAMRDHPDRAGPGASDAERAAATARFQRLSAAYHCLRDARRRRDYDAGTGGHGGA